GTNSITLRDHTEPPTLAIRGPGALNHPSVLVQTGVVTVERPQPVLLAPGETHTVRVSCLGTGASGDPFACWLLPADYTITGYSRGCVSPAPKDSDVVLDGFASVTISLAPLAVKVLPGKPPVARPLEELTRLRRPPPPGTVIVPGSDDASEEAHSLLFRPV